MVLTCGKHNTHAPYMHWPPGLLSAAKSCSASYMSPANSYSLCAGAWKLLEDLCSRHPRSMGRSTSCAGHAGWCSWRGQRQVSPEPLLYIHRILSSIAGDEPFQESPSQLLGGCICIPPISFYHSIETFDMQKFSSLRNPNVVSQEIPTM